MRRPAISKTNWSRPRRTKGGSQGFNPSRQKPIKTKSVALEYSAMQFNNHHSTFFAASTAVLWLSLSCLRT